MNTLTKIFAAAVIIGLGVFAWTQSFAQGTQCNTPEIIAQQAESVGVAPLELSGGIVAFVGEELEAAKDFLADRGRGQRHNMVFDRIEVYTHHDPKLVIVAVYISGCAVAVFPEEFQFVEELVEYVRKGV